VTRLRAVHPPDVTAANLFTLKRYPAQTFDVWLGRWWKGALAVNVRKVQVKQAGPELYSFALGVRWSDRREAMFPDFRLVVQGAVRTSGDDGAEIEIRRVTYHPNWRSWTPAMAGAGLVAVVLCPLLWWAQGPTFGTIFVGLYGVVIIALAGGAWWAFRRGAARALRTLLRQAGGTIDLPVADWHDYLFPEEPKGQYYSE